jgi:hypothetical protein
VLGALAALLLVAASPADAANVTSHGSLVVRWQSNPATCAEHGLCDRSGVLSWRPDSEYASLDLVDANFAFLALYSSQAVARSHRGTQACVDRVTGPSEIVAAPGPRGHAFVFSMSQAADQLGFGRCAGPLGPDFGPALPQSAPVTVAALRRGAVIDLRARKPFSSGPFEGEVISTLTLRTEREGTSDEGGSTGTTGPHSRLIRFGSVAASYAIESLSGDAGYSFGGSADPECSPFDTCGLAGELMLHPDLSQGSIRFDAVRRLPTGRETVASGLRALRQGRARGFGESTLGPPFNPDRDEGEPSVSIPLTASATPAGGATCSETGSYTEPNLDIDRRVTGFAITLEHGGNSQPDPLRTRCPGPGGGDMGPLARATLPASAIGQPRIELTLRPAPGFVAPGFRGTGRGELTLSLRLTSVRALTRLIRVESGGLFE